MKNIKLFSLILLTTSILLSSCSSSLTITKRHSKRGYYLASNHIRNSHNLQKQAKKTHEQEVVRVSEPVFYQEENLVAKEALITTTAQEKMQATSSNVTQKQENLSQVTAKKHQPESKSMADKNLSKQTKHTLKDFKTVKQSIKSTRAMVPAAADALSLFWIIIVLILILWLLGILSGGFGIGGLINLLLVIALILLILWLLRII